MGILVVVVLSAIAIVWLLNPFEGQRNRVMKRAAGSNPWHAISISFDDCACEAAKSLEARRFLASDTVAIPLQNCTSASSCECTYLHHQDRRSGRDRRNPDGLHCDSGGWGPRGGAGRRKSDWRIAAEPTG